MTDDPVVDNVRWLFDALKEQKKLSEANQLLAEIASPNFVKTASSLTGLSAILRNHGKLHEAEAACREALAIYEKNAEVSPAYFDTRKELVETLKEQSKWAEIEVACREALGHREKPWMTDDVVVDNVQWLFDALKEQKKLSEANQLLAEIASPNFVKTASSLTGLSAILRNHGKLHEAEAACREALAIYERNGEVSQAYFDTRKELVETLKEQSKWAEIEVACREALGHQEKPWMTDDAVVDNVRWLFDALKEQKKLSEVNQLLAEIASPDFVKTASSLMGLSAILRDHGKLHEAEAACREALAIYEKNGEMSQAYFDTRKELLNVLEEQSKWAEIEVTCREVLRQREKPWMRDEVVVDY